MSNHALVLTAPNGSLNVITRPIPIPSGSQVVIRNSAIALNPVDHKIMTIPMLHERFGIKDWPAIAGNDVAGTVHSVGSDVSAFKPGDRVAAFTMFDNNKDFGGFQEYTLLEQRNIAKIPEALASTAASTIPSSVITAVGALNDLGISLPESAGAEGSASGKTATLLVWGGASSVGVQTIQVAKRSGATVFATASPQHHAFLHSLGADEVFDYRSPTLVSQIQSAMSARGLTKFTASTDSASADLLATANVVGQVGGGKLAAMVPWEFLVQDKSVKPPENVEIMSSGAYSVLRDPKLAAKVMNELVSAWLGAGKLKPHNVQVVQGGLEGIAGGLKTLGKGVSGVKLVVEV